MAITKNVRGFGVVYLDMSFRAINLKPRNRATEIMYSRSSPDICRLSLLCDIVDRALTIRCSAIPDNWGSPRFFAALSLRIDEVVTDFLCPCLRTATAERSVGLPNRQMSQANPNARRSSLRTWPRGIDIPLAIAYVRTIKKGSLDMRPFGGVKHKLHHDH